MSELNCKSPEMCEKEIWIYELSCYKAFIYNDDIITLLLIISSFITLLIPATASDAGISGGLIRAPRQGIIRRGWYLSAILIKLFLHI